MGTKAWLMLFSYLAQVVVTMCGIAFIVEKVRQVMNPNAISITASPRTKITVELVGVEYEILPPKAAFGLKMAVNAKLAGDDDPSQMAATTDEWIVKAFGKVEAAKVRKRLDNDDDDLDFPHIMELMQKLTELVSGNPTS